MNFFGKYFDGNIFKTIDLKWEKKYEKCYADCSELTYWRAGTDDSGNGRGLKRGL